MPNFSRRLDRTHFSEFPEVSIDSEARWLLNHGFTDESWHNDAGPRFIFKPKIGPNAGKAIEHLRALKRQAGGTFYAVDLRCGAQPVTEAELMAVVIAAEERRYYAR